MRQPNKNILLSVSFVLILVIAYLFSFSNTLETKEELEELKQQIKQTSALSYNKASLHQKEAYLDSVISHTKTGKGSLQNNLLNTLNKYSEDLDYKIIDFKEPHLYTSQDSRKITSLEFTLEGRYKSLEQILYKLEKEYIYGSVSHLSFEKKKDYRTNRKYLQAVVLIRNLI